MRMRFVLGALFLAVFVPSLAHAYCGVRINGKWEYSGGTCADWNDYAQNSGDNGFACFNFGTAVQIVRHSPTEVSIVGSSGQQMPLASDAMQRAFDRVVRKALAHKPPQRILIRDDHGVISNQRLAEISKRTGAKIVNAGRGVRRRTQHRTPNRMD
ncbi:MAG TPA: hypothetical protein VNJ52_12845 [Patescibacteria group bacterium]|nr:hypothetical protein [Patescibacteria group bacterium]